jgi:hypothetical protein
MSSALCVLSFRLSAEPLSENQARLGVVTGDVGLLSQGAVDWIEAHEGLPIETGDRIRTGEDGRVELIASELALWVLEPNTDVVAEHIEADAGLIDLNSGALYGTVDSERAAGRSQRWEFNTPAAVLAVCGTEFALDVSKQEGTRMGVFEGKVAMQTAETAEGPQPPIEVSSGQEAAARRGRPIQTSAKLGSRLTALSALRGPARRRQKQIEGTWSPFTPTVRADLRRRFVAPPAKHSPLRHAVSRKRRRPQNSEITPP